MRLLQIMAGAEQGGAEIFFNRLSSALKASTNIQQHLIIRKHKERVAFFEKEEIEFSTAPFSGFLDFETPKVIKRALASFAPDIVMTWMSRASAFCPEGEHTTVARLGGYYDLKYYRKVDYLVGNTPDIVGYFCRQGWPQHYTRYLPNFAPLPVGQAIERDRYDTPHHVPLLLSLGRFHDDKAFDILIPALAEVPHAYLWLGGEGEEEPKLRALAKKHRVEERIRFLGWQQDTTPLFLTADVYVCPSRVEPLGNVVIEAWSHRCPVVAAASAGPGSLIDHEQTGLLCDIDDVSGLAYQLRKLIASPELRDKFRETAFSTFEENFSKERVIQNYCGFFDEIRGTKRSR